MYGPLWKGNLDPMLLKSVPDENPNLTFCVFYPEYLCGMKQQQEINTGVSKINQLHKGFWRFMHQRVGLGGFCNQLHNKMNVRSIVNTNFDVKPGGRMAVGPVYQAVLFIEGLNLVFQFSALLHTGPL